MKHNNKLYYVVALTTLLMTGFLATTFISYFVARDSLSRQLTDESLPLTSDNIYSEIQRDLLSPVLISSLMARDTFVRDWVLSGEHEPDQIRNYLQEIQQKYATITAFFISEKTLRYYHPDGVIKTLVENDPADDWYFRVRKLNAPYDINVDTDTADRSRMNIFINHRVLDYEGKFIGVTGVGLSVDSVARLVESYQRRYGRNIYFIDREGSVTLHGSGFNGLRRIQEHPGLAQRALHILTSPSTSTSYERADGTTVYVNSRLVPEFDWLLLVEQESAPGSSRLQTSLFINIVVSLGVTILVMFAAYFTISGYQRRLEQMATTDKLTGVANRQAFDIVYEHVIRSMKRLPRPISVALLDIDHFKDINDTYGHNGGDEVIKQVADVIRRHVRDSDTVCRWGGEEFLILFDDCPLGKALECAEAIRRAIKEQSVRYGREKISVTTSVGVAQLHPNQSPASLIGRADAALYLAKNSGRDQARTDDELEPGRDHKDGNRHSSAA